MGLITGHRVRFSPYITMEVKTVSVNRSHNCHEIENILYFSVYKTERFIF